MCLASGLVAADDTLSLYPEMTGVDSPHTHRKFSSFSLVVVVIVVVSDIISSYCVTGLSEPSTRVAVCTEATRRCKRLS